MHTPPLSSSRPWAKLVAYSLAISLMVLVFSCQKWLMASPIMFDIWSYYAYLPATFIEGDLSLSFLDEHPEYIDLYYQPVYTEDGARLIKMSMGLAVIYSPYFFLGHLWAHLHTGMAANGFSQPYQITLMLAGPIHLLIGLLSLRKFLLAYVSEKVVAWTFIFIVLGSNLAYYASNDGPMPHVHNFMLFSLFLRGTQLWFREQSWKHTIWLGLLSGLIVLVRPNNVLIGLSFIFFGVHHWQSLKAQLQLFWNNAPKLGSLLALAFLVLLPQLFYWKYVSGDWICYSYKNGEYTEGFFFDRPRIYLGLFSYTKGWLLYSPLMIVAILGLFRLPKGLRWAFPIYLLLNSYIILSWWCWWYGGSFGHRAFIDVYPFLSLGFALFFQAFFNWSRLLRWGVGSVLGAFLALSIFQTWQYIEGIIHWDSMSKKTYWDHFLRTEKTADYEEWLIIPDYEAALKGEVSYWNDYRKKEEKE